MTETDRRTRGVSQGEGSPGRPLGRPMRQLEFNQAMSDFRHMFPETDEEVIEAVLRANNGMVDATIDQLLTMNIDADVRDDDDDDDDLPDHILMSVERDVQQLQHLQHQPSHQGSRRTSREARATRKALSADTLEKQQPKDSEDCPPSYTEAVQSHLSHHHRSSNTRSRHRNSPTTINGSSGHMARPALGTMQHLLDLGPDSAPGAGGGGGISSQGPSGYNVKQHHSHHHSSHHHHNNHHYHLSRSSNHHRRRGDTIDGSPSKSRPGRNLLATTGAPLHGHHDIVTEDICFRPQRKGSLDSNDFNLDSGVGFAREKSPHRWRTSHREMTSVKRPVYRNWNPPLLGTLPDDFLRIITPPSIPARPVRHGVQLQRTMSAVGPERPHFYPTSPSPSNFHTIHSSPTSGSGQQSRQRPLAHRPQRSLSFAGNTSQPRRPQNIHPASGLAQHEFSTDILQERMKENERRRQMTSSGLDPDLAQYLEDERLAIMLQNSEFLQELRGDRIFMMTLEREQRSEDSDRTKQEVQPDALTTSDLGGDDRDFIEGYGDDRRDTLEAFPFSQQLPPPVSEDVELRKKLKNMGKASRKQFAALARRFFLKRRKKSAQQILKESQAPSMMNLLDEDEDNDEDNDGGFPSGEHHTTSEPHTSSSNTQNTNTKSTMWSSSQSRQHFDVV